MSSEGKQIKQFKFTMQLIDKRKYDKIYAENIQLKKKLLKYENNTVFTKQKEEIKHLKHKCVKTANSWENKYNKLKRFVDHERYLYNKRLNEFLVVKMLKYFQLLITLKKSYFVI